MDGEGNIIEVQGTGEGRPFNMGEALQLLELCQKGNQVLQQKQKEILGELV
jgi:ribonuclease PH